MHYAQKSLFCLAIPWDQNLDLCSLLQMRIKDKRERALTYSLYLQRNTSLYPKCLNCLDFILSKGFHRQQGLTHNSQDHNPRARLTSLTSIWCLTKQEGLTEVNWRQPALNSRVGQITIWDRLHADWEISISRDQYSKSKTSRVKKSYSSSLKKKKNLFFPYPESY